MISGEICGQHIPRSGIQETRAVGKQLSSFLVEEHLKPVGICWLWWVSCGGWWWLVVVHIHGIDIFRELDWINCSYFTAVVGKTGSSSNEQTHFNWSRGEASSTMGQPWNNMGRDSKETRTLLTFECEEFFCPSSGWEGALRSYGYSYSLLNEERFGATKSFPTT